MNHVFTVTSKEYTGSYHFYLLQSLCMVQQNYLNYSKQNELMQELLYFSGIILYQKYFFSHQ